MHANYGHAGAAGQSTLPRDLTRPRIEPAGLGVYGPPPGCIQSDWFDVYTEFVRQLGEQDNRLTGPIQFVLKLLDFWGLESKDAVGLLGFRPIDADHVAAVLSGHEQFRGRDVRERIAHLFHIRATLRSLFRDLETENDWLRERHPLLGDRSPLSLMGGSMEDFLLVKEYVQYAAGR